MDNFASLDTFGDPGGVKVVELSGMKPKSADSVTVIETHARAFLPLNISAVGSVKKQGTEAGQALLSKHQ